MGFFSITLFILLIFGLYKSKKAMHMLQQNYYDESNRYLFWMFKNLKKVFYNLDILFITFIVFMLCDIDATFLCGYCFGLYLILFVLYRNKISSEQTKKPLVITSRIKRLFTTESIIYLAVMIPMVVNYNENHLPIYYLIIGGMIYLSYFVILIANKINIIVPIITYKNIYQLKSLIMFTG